MMTSMRNVQQGYGRAIPNTSLETSMGYEIVFSSLRSEPSITDQVRAEDMEKHGGRWLTLLITLQQGKLMIPLLNMDISLKDWS